MAQYSLCSVLCALCSVLCALCSVLCAQLSFARQWLVAPRFSGVSFRHRYSARGLGMRFQQGSGCLRSV